MIDEEIVKALELCAANAVRCKECPYFQQDVDCVKQQNIDLLNYVNRLKSENAELRTLCKKKAEELTLTEWIKMVNVSGGEVKAILDERQRRYPQYVEHAHNEQEIVTDEQIEKQLERAASNGVDFSGEVLNYINRLKDECRVIHGICRKNSQDHKIGISKQRTYWKNKVEQGRKKTAKEILQRLLKWKSSVIFDTESVVIAEEQFTESVKALAVEEYGVELADEQ